MPELSPHEQFQKLLFKYKAAIDWLHKMGMLPDSVARVLVFKEELRQIYELMAYDLALLQPENEWLWHGLFQSPTAKYSPDLSSTRIESDFCSSIVTVQRMSPLRLFKIRWNLKPIIFPSS